MREKYGFRNIVRYEEDRPWTSLPKVEEEAVELSSKDVIECRKGFIEEHYIGIGDEGSSQ